MLYDRRMSNGLSQIDQVLYHILCTKCLNYSRMCLDIRVWKSPHRTENSLFYSILSHSMCHSFHAGQGLSCFLSLKIADFWGRSKRLPCVSFHFLNPQTYLMALSWIPRKTSSSHVLSFSEQHYSLILAFPQQATLDLSTLSGWNLADLISKLFQKNPCQDVAWLDTNF